jgi:hypothetical protein
LWGEEEMEAQTITQFFILFYFLKKNVEVCFKNIKNCCAMP